MRVTVAAIAFALCAIVASNGVRAEDDYRFLRLDDNYVKWGPPLMRTSAKVRYALVTGPAQFLGVRNCGDMNTMDRIAGAAKTDLAAVRAEIAAGFALWEAEADIAFEPAEDQNNADILIGTTVNPEGWAFTDVSYDHAGDHAGLTRTKSIKRALICVNAGKPWKIGFGGDLGIYDFRYVFAHEIGHAIGLGHSGEGGQVMSLQYGEQFRTLQGGDRAGVIALYGRKRPPPAAVP